MTAAVPIWALQDQVENRSAHRFPVAVPAAVKIGDQEYSARVLNVAPGGAMIETNAPLLERSKLTLHCGTVSAAAAVVWRKGHQLGINFDVPLTHGQLNEQVSRSAALAFRRERRLQPGGCSRFEL